MCCSHFYFFAWSCCCLGGGFFKSGGVIYIILKWLNYFIWGFFSMMLFDILLYVLVCIVCCCVYIRQLGRIAFIFGTFNWCVSTYCFQELICHLHVWIPFLLRFYDAVVYVHLCFRKLICSWMCDLFKIFFILWHVWEQIFENFDCC